MEAIYVLLGENEVIIVAGTMGKGHITRYLIKKFTVALTVPFELEEGEEGFKLLNKGVRGGEKQVCL